MKTVSVLKTHSYGGRQRLAGQTYNLPDAVAILFCKIGRVREELPLVVKRPLPQAKSVPETPTDAVEEADKKGACVADVLENEKPKRRRYRRRDLEAEEA